ncbi:hypothetical protein ACFE04_028827 [Oxalis oulophora]
MEPKSPSKHKTRFTNYKRVLKPCIIALITLLLLLAGIYFLVRVRKAQTRSSYYTVVVDCGSTGTRVNVYEWESRSVVSVKDLPVLVHTYPDDLTKSKVDRNSCQYHCMQTEPGLDKFVGNGSAVRESLKPLVKWAEKWVPYERHSETPIFVLATAGLRRLEVNESRRVLDDVYVVLTEHSFSYDKSWIRVLTGKEEAYFGWVALNYKMDSLRNSTTLGLLDLGGSSLQVVIEKNDTEDDKNLVRSKIGSVEHQILAYSLPDFGLNEAFDRTVFMLSQVRPLSNISGRIEVKHPCLSSNFVKNYTCHVCSKLNMTENSQTQNTEFGSVLLSGDPNWEQCKELARAAALNTSKLDWPLSPTESNCKGNRSSFTGSDIFNLTSSAHPLGRFHALSGFFVVYKNLNLTPKANLTKIWEKGQQLCLNSWRDPSSILEQYCFKVPYMTSLIDDALCLGESDIIFGPSDVSWPLGAALVEGQSLWLPRMQTQSHVSILRNMKIYSPIFLFILLLGLLFIVYRSQLKLPMLGKKGPATRHSLPSYVFPKRRPW